MPGSGSLTRSAVNQQAGAVTQWSGVFSAIAVAVTVLLFAPFAQYIPRASLAGLLMLAAFRMVDLRQLLFHLRATGFDALIVTALFAKYELHASAWDEVFRERGRSHDCRGSSLALGVAAVRNQEV